MDFQVKALSGKEIVLLNITAAHADEASAQVKAKGFSPIGVKAKATSFASRDSKKFPLTLFSQELLALLEAGLNLVEAIETLVEKESRNEVKHALNSLLQSLYEGQTFSAALESQASIFPVLYIATVRASEKTGDLSEALTRYVAYENQLGVLKKKIVSASIYPILLMVVGGLVILFLMGFVVPKFSKIYEDTGGDLPFLSQLLLAWGVFLEAHSEQLLIAMMLAITGFVYAISRPALKKWFIQLLWRIPAIGKQLRVFQLARFYRTLGMLQKGGTPIIAALQSVAGLLDAAMQTKMKQAIVAIQQGQLISNAMESAGLTTPVALRMLRVGEKSGKIGDMMERIAAFYDDELSRWIDWFTRLFEPLLMLLIGLVIGVVVLLLYMPIFELAGSIQ
jgi:general secretion pathway protein F